MLTCATLAAAIAAAQPGAVLTLTPGSDCPAITVRNHHKAKPVTLVLDGAAIRGLTFWNSSGFIVKGGTLSEPTYKAYAGRLRDGSHSITFEGVTFTDAVRGLVMGGAHDVVVRNSDFFGLKSDGINVVSSQRVTLADNRIGGMDYTPSRCVLTDESVIKSISKAKCKGKGGAWTDGHHPDGIQLWGPGLADITIERNRLNGAMQGIVFFGSTKGVPPTRVTIRDNHVRIANFSWGISAYDQTELTLTDNDVDRLPGNTYKIKVLAKGSTGTICGNTSPSFPQGARELQPCPKVPATPAT